MNSKVSLKSYFNREYLQIYDNEDKISLVNENHGSENENDKVSQIKSS